MRDGITVERIAIEEELARSQFALHIRDITDNGRTIIRVFADIMDGKTPDATREDRINAAREIIALAEFIPAAAERVNAAQTFITESADRR